MPSLDWLSLLAEPVYEKPWTELNQYRRHKFKCPRGQVSGTNERVG